MNPGGYDALIERLRERIREDRPSTDLPIEPPTLPRPPLGEQDILRAERELGCPLLELVRQLYSRVADGGYGPGYGIYPLLDADGGCTVVGSYQAFAAAREEGDPAGPWPERLLEFCGWGCNSFSAIDCARLACPVIRFDPDRWTDEGGLAGCLVPESDALAEWLTAWLDGEQLWKRVHGGG